MILIRRALAYLVDIFIGLSPWMIYGYFWGKKLSGGGFSLRVGHGGLLGLIILFLPFVLYMILAEYFSGRSAGKWIFRLRVVRADGRRLKIEDAVKRHLPDIVELILIPIIAVVSACADQRQRRIGDMWAGTLVKQAAVEKLAGGVE